MKKTVYSNIQPYTVTVLYKATHCQLLHVHPLYYSCGANFDLAVVTLVQQILMVIVFSKLYKHVMGNVFEDII